MPCPTRIGLRRTDPKHRRLIVEAHKRRLTIYGSFMRLKVKPGQEQAVADVLKEWETKLKPNIKGAIGGLLLKPDSGAGELLGAAIFQDKSLLHGQRRQPGAA